MLAAAPFFARSIRSTRPPTPPRCAMSKGPAKRCRLQLEWRRCSRSCFPILPKPACRQPICPTRRGRHEVARALRPQMESLLARTANRSAACQSKNRQLLLARRECPSARGRLRAHQRRAGQRQERSLAAPGWAPVEAARSCRRRAQSSVLSSALAQVKRNKGAPGIDGMTVEDLGPYLKEHWLTIRAQLLEGTYRPQPVRRVEISKASGGLRLLGIPTPLA